MTGGRGDHHPTTPYRPPRRHQLNQSFQRSLNYTYGSIEDEGGVTAPDPGELQQEVLELSHTNKRLTGENQELTTHLTVAEETNANLREQCVTLRHALQGVQQQLESARALEAEVEAARRQVEEGREDREELLSHLAHLERENNSLSTRLHDLAEQMSAAQEELEGLTLREEEAVRRHRDEVTRLSSQLSHWKAQAETQTLTAYRLQETLEDVKKLVEGLREEKKSLEEQLNHVKEELAAATHSESDVSGLSGLDAAEGRMALDTSSTEKSTDGSGLESSGVGVSPTTPAVFTTATTNASAASTPLVTSLSQPSPSVNTPQSIHSEIQTMGEVSGSLPFCEKIEGGSKEDRRSGSLSEAGDSPLASVLASMLRWWREWEERGIPLLRAMLDKDTVALHQHVAAHYEELVRLERELQDIRRATQASPATSGVASMEEAMKDGSVGSAQDSALPSSQATTPTLPTRRSRTPGSHVSQLIYMFESSSQSSSPVLSESSERPGSVEHPSSLSRMLMRARWQQRRSSDDGTRSESTNSDDVGSIDPTLRDSLENVRCEDSQNGLREDTYDGRGPASGTELEVFSNELALDEAVGSEHMDKGRACVLLEYGLEPEEEEKQDEITKADIDSHPSYICHSLMGEDRQKKERTKDDIQVHPSITPRNQEVEKQKENVKVNGSTAVVDVSILEPERDIFMETSHLMKLMNEVTEQRNIIEDLRRQLTKFEDERERQTATLQRLYRLVVKLFHETRWTEGVRREWLAVVVPRVRGRVEEGEGAESLTPATPTHPLDEVPLTTSFSREEIEALISARRDPLPCDTRTTNEDPGHVSNPENLAAELEKELTALRVHVLRSHALLHHYQSSSSSSQYGSRAEVSTPALPPPPPVQGVEVGVECDLCGPTCVPRPCDSTATQTPASPLSTTPDLEEPPTTTLLTTSSARREEEVEEERREEEQEAAQQEEEGRKDKEDRARGRRPRTQQQQRVKWKEDLKEEEEDKEEERDINEGATKEEEKLLVSVGGGAQDLPHPQQRPQQQPQRPPAPRQVGALDLPEHRQLRQVEVVPPAHRTLRQLGVGKEEEEEQQETGLGLEEGVEIIPMTSEHSLYSPKPAYDHLDHYRSGGQARGKGEEKLRRTGLSTVTPLMSSGAREAIPGPPRSRPRPQMELTPLSPPPSLDNVEEEDMEEEEEEEEEPALPSTPESSSSLASGDMFPHPPQSPRGPPRLPRQLSMSASDPPATKSPTTLAPLPEAAPPPAQPTQNEETQTEGSTSEEVKKTRVFPSLHDTVIQMASLARGDPAFTPNENLSPQEIETKFTQLSLAFKTDRLTLRQRLDLQQRHRDTAEDNHEADMDCLRRLVLEIQAECTDSDLCDAISQVRRHLDVLATSSSRLVSISEVWGAVQQEWRLARAVEVIFRHVEDVKRKYETVKQELEELRGLLTEYKIELPVSNAMGNVGGGRNSIQGSSDSPSTSRRIRALSLIDCANKPGSEKEGRRPSMAPKSSSSNPFSRARSRRASLMADIRPFKEITFLGPVAAAAAATKESSSSSSTSSSSSGSSLPTRDRGEEGPGGGVQPPGRLNCVIAEEGSESGEEEGGASSQDAASPTTATTTAATTTTTYTPSTSTSNLAPLSLEDLSRLQAIAERGRLTDDSDEGSNDDRSQSEFSQGSSASYSEPAPASFPASLWNRLPSQHWLVVGTIQMLEWGSRLYALFSWLLVAIKEVLAWARGGQWPYSQQQTVLGARYACASLLLLAAAFLLLVTLSSGDASVPQPYHPGWTTMHHILHPFVTLRYLGPPPT